jgi:hypothetical protein
LWLAIPPAFLKNRETKMQLFIASASGDIEVLTPPPPPSDLGDMCLLVFLIFLGLLVGALVESLIEWGMGE